MATRSKKKKRTYRNAVTLRGRRRLLGGAAHFGRRVDGNARARVVVVAPHRTAAAAAGRAGTAAARLMEVDDGQSRFSDRSSAVAYVRRTDTPLAVDRLSHV